MTRQKNKMMFRWNLKRTGVLGGIFAAVVGSGYIYHQSHLTFSPWSSFHQSPSNADKEESKYIYIPQHQKDSAQLEEYAYASRWWPKREHKSQWRLLRLARSKDKHVRHLAIKALAELALDDSEFREIAQACDLQTAVGLARTHGSDLRFFLLPPLQVRKKQKNIEADFKELLVSLPLNSDLSKCIQHITQYAIKTGYHTLEGDNQSNEWLVGEGLNADDDYSQHRPYKFRKETVNEACLQALLKHTTVPSHRKIIVRLGALPLLHRICQEKQENYITESLVAQIIGNLALDKSLHTPLFMGGWVYTLTKWSKSSHLSVSLPASRALANMDNDKVSDVTYEDGIYLLHPQVRGREKHVNADIVFIHGLLGGAFRTWRQNDRVKPTAGHSMSTKLAEESVANNMEQNNSMFHATLGVVKDNYTHCWPKDWLAQECPHLRILAVDYYSHFSIWRDICYVEDESRSLLGRGNDVLTKLIQAGIGSRPIVWVTHSMGGLIVKQMLLQAAANGSEDAKNVLRNTVGIVFYSVPHRGSSLMDLNSGMKLLLLPTKEVKEMKKNSPFLLELHEKFKKLAEDHNISCLSFGETKKTKLGLKWSALMVSQDSSDPKIGEYYAVPENHLDTCKPESKDSQVYHLLVEFIHNHIPHTLIENLLYPTNAEDMETSVVMGLMQ